MSSYFCIASAWKDWMDVLERDLWYCNATVVTILLADELVNQAQAAKRKQLFTQKG
jgi:hypothetical protein